MSAVQLHAADWRALFSKRPSLQLMVGGLVFVVLLLSGIGAVAWGPAAVDVATEADIAGEPPAQPRVDRPGRHRCQECGVVESSRTIVRYPEGADRDRATPMTPGMRSQMVDPVVRVSEVTVRMSDGTTRQFVDGNLSRWRPGERMIFIDGVSATGR